MTRWELGQEGDVAYGCVVLVGRMRPDAEIAVLHSSLELKLWLKSHRKTWVDPELWLGVAHVFYEQTMFIAVGDWNRGERVKLYQEGIQLPDLTKQLAFTKKLMSSYVGTGILLGVFTVAFLFA